MAGSGVRQAAAQPRLEEAKFDIPSQSLADALVAFASTTGLEILVDDALVSGRRSTEISGTFHPTIALRRIVSDPALDIRYLDSGAVTLQLRGPGRPPTTDNGQDPYPVFSAAVQAALLRQMCMYGGGAANFRVAAQLWIGPDGRIEHSLLLDSTGDRGRDAEIADLLTRLVIGQARPADLPQPATIIVVPRSSPHAAECGGRRAGRAP